MSAQTWQPIVSVRLWERVTVWLESVEDDAFAMTGQIHATDPVLCITQDDGTNYWPHENGRYPTHWIDAPRPDTPNMETA